MIVGMYSKNVVKVKNHNYNIRCSIYSNTSIEHLHSGMEIEIENNL